MGSIVCATCHQPSSAVTPSTCQCLPPFHIVLMLCSCWLLHRRMFRRSAATVRIRSRAAMCVGLRYSAVRSHAAGRVTSASTPIWRRHPEGTAEQLRDGFRARTPTVMIPPLATAARVRLGVGSWGTTCGDSPARISPGQTCRGAGYCQFAATDSELCSVAGIWHAPGATDLRDVP